MEYPTILNDLNIQYTCRNFAKPQVISPDKTPTNIRLKA